ncbi:hypothetical protein [Caenimonas koreensis]|uniref:Uncharacterized protein n=1 Tax=Caenimonas koreensis DSM 17982 TaxID=1121255 RepID=A0A844B843_9BURK|nr:hypothetical protein [Caenimonas koreensis]MRD46701.1 hypothetical protein [Caenimonas koreensis DSM 17982]
MAKSTPEAEQTLPDAQTLSPGFLDWLKQNFKWLFNTTSTVTSVGTAYIYDEGGNLLGEYDNGSALGKGRTEYIWLPTDSGQSMPIGFYGNGKFFAVHTDHLGTTRLATDETKKPVWQLPYAFPDSAKQTPLRVGRRRDPWRHSVSQTSYNASSSSITAHIRDDRRAKKSGPKSRFAVEQSMRHALALPS